LTELFAGFSSDDFQQQLQELAKSNSERSGNDLRCMEGRLALTLAVQRQVLPNYGFTGDEDGVLAMKMAVRKHMGDPRVARKSMDIRDKLLLPELQKDAPTAPAAERSKVAEVAPPPPAPPAPARQALAVPAQASDAPVKAACDLPIKKDLLMEVMVQHTQGHGQLVVEVPAEGATMMHVKEAVVEKLGRGTAADVKLVMWGGGMFVNHRDCDEVNNDRVFATGLDLRGVN
jgi:hypothetical protein